VDGGKGGPDASRATPINVYCVTASGNSTSRHKPEGTKNAVFAKYAFGVQR
jgi:hypothetical protein